MMARQRQARHPKPGMTAQEIGIVTLTAANSATPTFTAPAVSTDTILTFQLIVNDGITDSRPAQVTVTVPALPSSGGQTPSGTQTPDGTPTPSDSQTPTGAQTPRGGGGGGCTLNPGAGFDPLLGGMTGFLLAYLVWQRFRKGAVAKLFSRELRRL
jgi:hypothetical protein